MIYLVAVLALSLAWGGTKIFLGGLRIWRNQPLPGWVTRPNPVMSEAMWDGMRRALVPLGVCMWCISGLSLATVVIGASDPSGTPTPGSLWVNLVLWLGILGLLVNGTVTCAVVAFNRPRFLVPRHLRDQLGSWVAYRRGV